MEDSNLMDLSIFRRRSVRKFCKQSIKKEQIQFILDAAMAAPSANNYRPWNFLVIDQLEHLKFLAGELKHGQVLNEAQAAILVCGVKDHNGKADDFWVQSCSASTQNILLGLTEIGLGGVWLGIYPRGDRVEMLQNRFELPKTIVPFSLVALGVPLDQSKSVRTIEKNKVHWNQW